MHVGSLTERKNVVRLADAFPRLGRGSLTFVGDGPLRAALESRGARVIGRVRHEEVPAWLSAADVVCGPALIEPFGQALLEAMACGRSVVATRVGGPPEFVPPEAGVLVDPLDTADLTRALAAAASLPSPNEPPGAPRPSTTSGARRSGWRRSSSEPFEIGEPDRDERPTLSSRPWSRATASACS